MALTWHHHLYRRSSAVQPRQRSLRLRAIGVPPDAPPPPPPPPPPRRTRLAASVISAPRQLDVYFEGSLYRRALWTCIAFAAGAAAFSHILNTPILAVVTSLVWVQTCGASMACDVLAAAGHGLSA